MNRHKKYSIVKQDYGGSPSNDSLADYSLIGESVDDESSPKVIGEAKEANANVEKEDASGIASLKEQRRDEFFSASTSGAEKNASRKGNEAKKIRMIPEQEALAVRYVKRRDKKQQVAGGQEVPDGDGGAEKQDEVTKMSEKLLEGVLGVKAERKAGERWVKMSESEIESCSEITKRLDDVDAIVDKTNKMECKVENVSENDESSERDETKKGARVIGLKAMPRKLSSERATSKLSKTRNFVRKDCIVLAREIRARRKSRTAALKVSVGRRVDGVEKIIEDRVEKIFEDAAERHPWLQPIETWLLDRRKSTKSTNSPAARQIGSDVALSRLSSDSESETSDNQGEHGNDAEGDETPSREIFIEAVNKSPKSDDKKKKNGNPLRPSRRKDSVESSSESPRAEDGPKSPEEKKEDRPKGGKTDKIEKHHASDLLEKLRGGFMEKIEDVQRYFQRTSRLADVNRKLKSQIWSSVVTIVLVEAKNLLPMDIDGLSDPYVKFRLGTEKYKSKVVNKTLSPVWLEQFDLHLYEDPYLGQELEVTVWDRDKGHQDDLMGRTTIDLASMERETTHRLWRDLEDGAGSIFLLLTISGTTASETISDLAAHEETPQERERLLQKYALANTLERPRDVGHLTVKVYRAQGLAAADLGGKSDPFCVLELVNARLQTQTEYKTLAPNWQKIFTFNVKDINSVLEVTVYDEDRDHKVEFLGRVAIPLLRIRNAEKRWYALKDKKLRGRAKGNSPQIMLELIVVWNVLRACVRTLNPKETKYMEPEVKFKRQVFLKNVLRLKAIIVVFIDMGKYIQSCWEWESKTRSIVALVLFVLACYYVEPWMIPVAAFLILLKYCMVAVLTGGSLYTYCQRSPSVGLLHDTGDQASDEGPLTPGDDDDDEDDKDKEEKKSLKERLQAIQEVTQTVQNSIGYIASLCERIKNLFNFTVPYLSYLAMIITILGIVVLYLIPLRYLILAWGVNKFLRKLLRPHTVPNNELLDLISRVPDDEDLLSYRELKPVPTADCERGGTSSASASGVAAATRRDYRKKHKPA